MSVQISTPETQPPVINTAEVGKITRVLVLIPAIGILLIATLCIVFGGLNARQLFNHNKTATSVGIVTSVRQIEYVSQNKSDPSCELGFTFDVNGRTYSGNSGSVTTSTNCYQKNGNAITVYYNPNDPSENGTSNSGGAIGLGFLVVGLVLMTIGIYIIRKSRNKMDDRATSAQITLIKNGFRDLGEFWQPRSMTRAEADQVLEDIQIRLDNQKRT